MNEVYTEILSRILNTQPSFYYVVETRFTIHHIERLMPTCRDRGKWKWIAEMKSDAWENKDKEAQRSHVDGADLFPRIYFYEESLIKELFMWLKMRDLEIMDIRTPKV